MVGRMPRMQVYLPQDLYRLIKERGLPVSELLQAAVRAEVRRQDLLIEGRKYLVELTAEVGKPTARQRARAKAVVQRIVAHQQFLKALSSLSEPLPRPKSPLVNKLR